MTSFPVKLSLAEFAELNRKFPSSRGSGDIGKRALEIVKSHFRGIYPGCEFVKPLPGADLAVIVDGADVRQFEVKGTADTSIAWQKLKVSSQASHDLLHCGSASILRVTNVYGEQPEVHELRCGQDFQLQHEPRWSFKRVHES